MLNNEQWKQFRAASRSPYHYWGEEAAQSGAQYIIELGGRSIGKSYFWRTMMLTDWFLNGSRIAYIRRYGEDVSPAKVAQYFAGVDWDKLTGGKFDGIVCKSGQIMAVKRDEKRKVIDSAIVGYYFAIALDEHYKSSDYQNIVWAVFEEFITRGRYLPDESDRLQNLISTLVRDNACTCVMIGNTITRACPYFSEWSLTHVPRMVAGDVDIYHVGETVIRVDMCAAAMSIKKTSSKMFFGKSKKMVAENEWHSDIFPKCPVNPYAESRVLHTVYFDNAGLTMRVEVRRSDYGDAFVWVTPVDFKFTHIENVRIVSRRLTSLSPYHQQTFRPLCPAELFIITAFEQGKIYYCDNLTGTDFKTIYQTLITPAK